MRFILLAVSLLVAVNSHSEINKNNYIYDYDDKEVILTKTDLRKTQEEGETIKFKIAQNLRKKGSLISSLASTSSEVVYKVGDASKHNIGAKNGMTPAQVINETYWGKPDIITKDSDEHDNFEQWTYNHYGSLHFDNGKLISILRW